jgi:hypothetical protein
MFNNGGTSLTDAESLGHPTTATTTQNEERAGKLILLVPEGSMCSLSERRKIAHF